MPQIIFELPLKGINKGLPSDRPMPAYSEYMNNVRAIDILERKIRISQRPSLDKWGDGDLIGGANQPVVAMCTVSSVA